MYVHGIEHMYMYVYNDNVRLSVKVSESVHTIVSSGYPASVQLTPNTTWISTGYYGVYWFDTVYGVNYKKHGILYINWPIINGFTSVDKMDAVYSFRSRKRSHANDDSDLEAGLSLSEYLHTREVEIGKPAKKRVSLKLM